MDFLSLCLKTIKDSPKTCVCVCSCLRWRLFLKPLWRAMLETITHGCQRVSIRYLNPLKTRSLCEFPPSHLPSIKPTISISSECGYISWSHLTPKHIRRSRETTNFPHMQPLCVSASISLWVRKLCFAKTPQAMIFCVKLLIIICVSLTFQQGHSTPRNVTTGK